jgi:hypothetical protein
VKADVKRMLRKFKLTGFKNGDLVLSAQIMRVTNKDWGRSGPGGIEVVDAFPECLVCKKEKRECVHHHIVCTGRGGQHYIMKLR